MDLGYLIPLIVTYALIDSVDPCFFAIYVSILISLGLSSPGRVLKASFLFITAVGLGYFILGYMLRSVLSWISLERSDVAPFIIIYGLAVVLYGVVKLVKKSTKITELVCREDMGVLCRAVKRMKLGEIRDLPNLIRYTYLVVLGLVMSLTILPCSAGLYFVYNTITVYTPIYLWIPLTLLYILVFVSPLILITLGLIGIFKTTKYMISWSISERYSELIRIVGGIVAIATGIYLYCFS